MKALNITSLHVLNIHVELRVLRKHLRDMLVIYFKKMSHRKHSLENHTMNKTNLAKPMDEDVVSTLSVRYIT